MVRLIISIVFFLILAVFIALNAQHTTDINFFGYQLEDISVVAVIIITMAVGVLYSFGLYLSSYLARKKQRKIKREKDIRKHAAEQAKAAKKQETAELAGDGSPASIDEPKTPETKGGRRSTGSKSDPGKPSSDKSSSGKKKKKSKKDRENDGMSQDFAPTEGLDQSGNQTE